LDCSRGLSNSNQEDRLYRFFFARILEDWEIKPFVSILPLGKVKSSVAEVQHIHFAPNSSFGLSMLYELCKERPGLSRIQHPSSFILSALLLYFFSADFFITLF